MNKELLSSLDLLKIRTVLQELSTIQLSDYSIITDEYDSNTKVFLKFIVDLITESKNQFSLTNEQLILKIEKLITDSNDAIFNYFENNSITSYYDNVLSDAIEKILNSIDNVKLSVNIENIKESISSLLSTIIKSINEQKNLVFNQVVNDFNEEFKTSLQNELDKQQNKLNKTIEDSLNENISLRKDEYSKQINESINSLFAKIVPDYISDLSGIFERVFKTEVTKHLIEKTKFLTVINKIKAKFNDILLPVVVSSTFAKTLNSFNKTNKSIQQINKNITNNITNIVNNINKTKIHNINVRYRKLTRIFRHPRKTVLVNIGKFKKKLEKTKSAAETVKKYGAIGLVFKLLNNKSKKKNTKISNKKQYITTEKIKSIIDKIKKKSDSKIQSILKSYSDLKIRMSKFMNNTVDKTQNRKSTENKSKLENIKKKYYSILQSIIKLLNRIDKKDSNKNKLEKFKSSIKKVYHKYESIIQSLVQSLDESKNEKEQERKTKDKFDKPKINIDNVKKKYEFIINSIIDSFKKIKNKKPSISSLNKRFKTGIEKIKSRIEIIYTKYESIITSVTDSFNKLKENAIKQLSYERFKNNTIVKSIKNKYQSIVHSMSQFMFGKKDKNEPDINNENEQNKSDKPKSISEFIKKYNIIALLMQRFNKFKKKKSKKSEDKPQKQKFGKLKSASETIKKHGVIGFLIQLLHRSKKKKTPISTSQMNFKPFRFLSIATNTIDEFIDSLNEHANIIKSNLKIYLDINEVEAYNARKKGKGLFGLFSKRKKEKEKAETQDGGFSFLNWLLAIPSLISLLRKTWKFARGIARLFGRTLPTLAELSKMFFRTINRYARRHEIKWLERITAWAYKKATKEVSKELAKQAAKQAGKEAGKAGGKLAGKTAGKMVPFVAFGVDAAFSLWEAQDNDLMAAAFQTDASNIDFRKRAAYVYAGTLIGGESIFDARNGLEFGTALLNTGMNMHKWGSAFGPFYPIGACIGLVFSLIGTSRFARWTDWGMTQTRKAMNWVVSLFTDDEENSTKKVEQAGLMVPQRVQAKVVPQNPYSKDLVKKPKFEIKYLEGSAYAEPKEGEKIKITLSTSDILTKENEVRLERLKKAAEDNQALEQMQNVLHSVKPSSVELVETMNQIGIRFNDDSENLDPNAEKDLAAMNSYSFIFDKMKTKEDVVVAIPEEEVEEDSEATEAAEYWKKYDNPDINDPDKSYYRATWNMLPANS